MFNIKGLMCRVLDHRYRVTRKVSPSIRELVCIRCGKEFGINYDLMSMLELDDDLRHVHDMILNPTKHPV